MNQTEYENLTNQKVNNVQDFVLNEAVAVKPSLNSMLIPAYVLFAFALGAFLAMLSH